MNIHAHGYNPSLIRHNGKLLISYRVHDRGDWRTNLFIGEFDDALCCTRVSPVNVPDGFKENSQEDCRLWEHKGQLWMSWTCSLYPADAFRSIVCYGQLTAHDTHYKVSAIIPQHGQNDFSAIEKNWPFFSHKNQLWSLYLTDERAQTFLQLDGGRVVEKANGKRLPWGWGMLHGGCIVRRPDGRLLHFFSSRKGGVQSGGQRYHLGCVELSGEPPFDQLRISKRPILVGEEGYNLEPKTNKRFKPSVVFTCGAIQEGSEIWLAYGWNDCQCRIAKLGEEDLMLV